MCFDARCQDCDVVPSLEHADNATIAVRIGHIDDRLSHRNKIINLQAKRTDWIVRMCVKASTDQHELRSDLIGRLGEGPFETSAILGARRTKCDWFVSIKA